MLLVLLQSGLAAGYAHSHPRPDCAAHTTAPHVHTCELLDLFDSPDHQRDSEDDHDADAIDLSDALAPAPPAIDLAAIDFAPTVSGVLLLESVTARAFPVGLPRTTAGPHRPLYLTFCALTI